MYLTAEYAWTRFQKIRSHALSLADTLFVGNAFVDSSCHRLSRAVSLFCVQHVRQSQTTIARNILGVTYQPSMILDKQADSVRLLVEIMQNLVLEIGITQEQYEIWTEMEMAEFFVLLQCRR